jgi:hypothetical protein
VLNKIYRHTQKNGEVSKVIKKCISHPTQAQHTLSAVGTVQVSHMLTSVRFSCLLSGCGTSFQNVAAGFLCIHVEVSRSVITVQREFHAWLKKDAPHKNNFFFKLRETHTAL